MILDKNIKLADAILKSPMLMMVLERFGIKFGLGEKTIEAICVDNRINPEVFLCIANLHLEQKYNPKSDFSSEDIHRIVEYLKNSHRYYSKEVLPDISKRIELLCKSNNDQIFNLIEKFFNEYIKEVNKHLDNEEAVVYPYAIDLINENTDPSQYSIIEYKHNHDDIETKLDDLKNLLIRHLPEKNDHKFRRDILLDLFAFEKDLQIHTIIEEHILIPQIELIEKTLK